MTPSLSRRLQASLLLLRLGIFVAVAFWVADKFVDPGHASQIAQYFYGGPALGQALVYGLGVVEGLILLAFVLGLWPGLSYLLVLLMHAASTLVAFPQYLHPWAPGNLLFFAAWPMLAACLTLYLLRDEDRLLSLAQR
jgi:hypothetical protein